tara:strand:- start:878 stop:1081 length:204 start_codon:yes stop_codon:yes gene_type:complete
MPSQSLELTPFEMHNLRAVQFAQSFDAYVQFRAFLDAMEDAEDDAEVRDLEMAWKLVAATMPTKCYH